MEPKTALRCSVLWTALTPRVQNQTVATTIEELRQRVQLERRLIARLKTANIRFTDAQVERIWAIVSAHQAGLSIRKIAGATGLSSSRIHQLLNAHEAKEIPVCPTSRATRSSERFCLKAQCEN
jgi:hypothetical protein